MAECPDCGADRPPRGRCRCGSYVAPREESSALYPVIPRQHVDETRPQEVVRAGAPSTGGQA